MPREHAGRPDAESLYRHRRELIASTAGTDIPLDSGTVRISNVPLFRTIEGSLYQCVRIRHTPASEPVPLRVRISEGDRLLDTVSLDGTAAETAFLFVPEVDKPTPMTVEVQAEGDQVARIPFDALPQRKWTIHLIHHSHYDIGYTDPQATVLASQLAYIDDALDLATMTDSWPEEAQFRWSIEVNYPLQHWLRTRSGAARSDLVRRVREGRIEVNALPFSMHTEAYSFDELARQLSFAQEMRDELGISISTAMQTDVPGSTIGLSTLLTDAGVDFLAVAQNYAGRSIPHLLDGQELTRPFRWQAPDGDSLMVWYTDTLHGSAYMEAMSVGFGHGFEDVQMSLPEYLNALAQRNYPYGSGTEWIMGSLEGVAQTRAGYPHDVLHMRVQGAYADNAPSSILPATIVREWNETYAWPRLMSSTNRAFADDVEARLGDRLDTFSGDWTDWWADGIGSGAVALGRNRSSQAAIRTAQSLLGAAQALGDPADAALVAEVDRAYDEMALFDEHTWGAANPWGQTLEGESSGEYQWARKSGFAYTAEERVRLLLQGGAERLAILTGSRAPGAGEPLAVFNPNSWPRTDLVRMLVPDQALPSGPFSLVEEDTGRIIPCLLEPQERPRFSPKGSWLTFLAENVPATGYLRYRLAPGHAPDDPADQPDSRLENPWLAVEVDPANGVIASIVEQSSGLELVDHDAPFGFNQYIHDRYTSGTGFNHLSSRIGRAGPWLLGARGTGTWGHLVEQTTNAVFSRARYRQSGQGAEWIETTLTLPHGVPRLHIANRLMKPSAMEKESIYFAFPFAGDHPRITWEVTGGTVAPEDRRVPGSARHFRAIRHWAMVEREDGPAVAWASAQAPLVQQANIHLPYAPFPGTIPPGRARAGTIYSWALNNIWDTNFPPQQGGDFRFDYLVAVDGRNQVPHLGRDAAAAVAQPLVGLRAGFLREPAGGPDRGSLLMVDHPEVEVTHLAPGEAGELVAYLQSHASQPVTVRVGSQVLAFTRTVSTTFLGTQAQPLAVEQDHVTVDIAPGELRSVRFAVNGMHGH